MPAAEHSERHTHAVARRCQACGTPCCPWNALARASCAKRPCPPAACSPHSACAVLWRAPRAGQPHAHAPQSPALLPCSPLSCTHTVPAASCTCSPKHHPSCHSSLTPSPKTPGKRPKGYMSCLSVPDSAAAMPPMVTEVLIQCRNVLSFAARIDRNGRFTATCWWGIGGQRLNCVQELPCIPWQRAPKKALASVRLSSVIFLLPEL